MEIAHGVVLEPHLATTVNRDRPIQPVGSQRLLERVGPRVDPADDPRTEALVEAYRQSQTPFWPALS